MRPNPGCAFNIHARDIPRDIPQHPGALERIALRS